MEDEKPVTRTKLFIAIPAYDYKVTLRQAISLAAFAQEAVRQDITIQIGSICGCSVVSRARNLLVADFMESDCTHLMFIDADINFEADAILRVLQWAQHEDRNIVAVPPRVRDPETRYIVNLKTNGDDTININGYGLVEVECVATAFMMIQRKVFEDLIADNPEWTYWEPKTQRFIHAVFDFKVTPEGYIGEDFLFCDRARAKGFHVWIDPAITLGHMGVQEYIGNYGQDVIQPMIRTPEEAKEE